MSLDRIISIYDFIIKDILRDKLGIYPDTTFADFVKHKAEVVGNKNYMTFIRDFDKGIDETYTYHDMHIKSNKIGNGLRKLGVTSGDGIALMNFNSPEFLLTVFSIFKIGGYVVFVNTMLKGEGLQYIIDHSDSKILVIHWSLLERYLKIKSKLPKIQKVIVDLNEAPNNFSLPEGIYSLQKLMESSDEDIESDINPKNISFLMYTSGTTGLPKAVTGFYGGSFYGDGLFIPTIMGYGQGQLGDTLYTCLPLFHSNGFFNTALAGYFNEFPVVISKKFSASRFWNIIRKYGVTNFNLLGSMPLFLLKQPERPNDRDNKVRRINTLACPKEIIKNFEERFGVKVYESYGATDGGGFGLGTYERRHENPPIGTMGKPQGNLVAEILDTEGNIMKPGEVGELVFFVSSTGAQQDLKRRKVTYYKDEKASQNKIKKGNDGKFWFHTGDLATKDENRWFFFVDRKRDSIRRRGENIAAWSVERIINKHDKVLESAAFGVKSSEYAEDEVMVAVVLKPEESMTPEELLYFLEDKLAEFMIPRFIAFVEKLPKNEVHRLMKRFLKDRGVTETTYDRENPR